MVSVVFKQHMCPLSLQCCTFQADSASVDGAMFVLAATMKLTFGIAYVHVYKSHARAAGSQG